jgi:ADP-heptose:LPS heptosyltransferase
MNEISTLERKVRMLQISWYTRPAGHDFVKICPCINRIMQESFFDKKKKKRNILWSRYQSLVLFSYFNHC